MSIISISITSYNACETIEDAIKSAINQEWPNKEIIIYDDFSTDDTVEILKKIEKLEPQIKVLYGKENKGVAYARNQLINHAKGEFIAFFDDDDISLPNRIRTQYEAIISAEKEFNSDLIICHTARQQIYPNGYQQYEATIGSDSKEIPSGKMVADRILYGRLSPGVIGSCATCSQMGRKSLYQDLNGFDESFRRIEDTEFNVRLALAGTYFVGIAEPLVIQNMTMAAHKNLFEVIDYHALLTRKHSGYLKECGWLGFNTKWQAVQMSYMSKKKMFFLYSIFIIFVLFPGKTITRIRWSLPALRTRRNFNKWHNGDYD